VFDELAKVLRAPRKRRLKQWAAFAQERGGRLNQASGSLLSYRAPSMDIPYGDALVHIDSYTSGSSNSRSNYTRFRATYILPSGPTFKVYKENILSPLADMFGFQDTELGDADFDRVHIVRTHAQVAAARAWTPEAMANMQRLGRGTAQSDGHVVKYTLAGIEKDATILGLGAELVGRLAHYAMDYLEGVKALPNARYVAPQGDWDERWPPSVSVPSRAGGEVRIFPILHGRAMTLCMATPPTRELQHFRVGFSGDGTPTADLAKGVLSADAKRALPEAAPVELGCDGRYVRCVFGGTLDRPRATAGLRLLESVAHGSSSQGAFR